MKEKKKDKNGEEYEVIAVLTDGEVRKFRVLEARKTALGDAIKAAMQGIADEIEKAERDRVRHWDMVAEKYNLVEGQEHQLNHRTREIRSKPKLWV